MKTSNWLLLFALLVLVLSVALSIVSLLPAAALGKQTEVLLDNSLTLTEREIYRQGLGNFHGGENITVNLSLTGNSASVVNFALLTYGGPHYTNITATSLTYTFTAGADYYEAVFQTTGTAPVQIHFQAAVTKLAEQYPFSWLTTPAKALFLASWAGVMLLILTPIAARSAPAKEPAHSTAPSLLEKKNLQRLKIGVLVSLLLWLVLLAFNTYPLATFENWYTDSARHPYTAVLFTKTGFSVFDTPLGALSNGDASFYKFVTWAEMPHLYPLGSIFLYLPFGLLLEAGVAQALVFKAQIALLLAVSHLCMYLFLRQFWKKELGLTPREFFLAPSWKNKFLFSAKAVATYILYIVLVVYAANGQFDAVAFLFALLAVTFFIGERYDLFLLFVAIASTFKYQAGIFLLPLIAVGLIRLLQKSTPLSAFFRNKVVLAALGLVAGDLFTAYLSAPFLLSARPELVMNGANAFSPTPKSPGCCKLLL